MTTKIIVKRYRSQSQYQSDARRMFKHNYQVTSVVSEAPRSGCMRILMLGPFALLFRPKPVLIVTYSHI